MARTLEDQMSGKSVVWRERLRRYDRSELTVAEFCQREGVSVPSFYQWRRRLAEISAGLRPPRAAPKRTAEPPAFQQVILSGSGVVAIEFPSGVRVELPAQQLPLVRAVVADLLHSESARGTGEA
jgi:transposase-like protein